MKNLLRVSIFIFALNFSAFSQTSENLDCPTLSVSGPPLGILNSNEPIRFSAEVKASESKIFTYNWTISYGEILSGQGTPTIYVNTEKVEGHDVTATVEILDFPRGCPNIASENSGTICLPQSTLLDEFSSSEQRIDKARMDNFFAELQNNPNDQGYIIEKFKRNTSKAVIKQKLAKISSYIKMRGFDPTRITIVHDLADEIQTQFWQVPPGATPPTVD